MNFLSSDRQREIERLLREGKSVRQVALAVGCVKNTVTRYRRVLNVSARCGCGQDSRHNGWCAWRYNESVERQRWMRVWTMPSKLLGRATEIRERYKAGESTFKLAKEFGVSQPTIWQCVNCTDVEPRPCAQCGVVFVPVYTGRGEFCSVECYRVLQDTACTDCGTPIQVSRGEVRFGNQCEPCKAIRRAKREDRGQWLRAKETLSQLRTVLRDQSFLQTEASKPARSSPR